MNNSKYYNDSLAHDFSLFMPKEYRREEIENYKSKNNINAKNIKYSVRKKNKIMKRKRNKETNTNKNNTNKKMLIKFLLSVILVMGFIFCYLLYMVAQYENGMINNNESKEIYTNSSLIDIYEGGSFK